MAFVKLADNYTDLIGKFAVALLAEGVDRNRNFKRVLLSLQVALLAEGVDRNTTALVKIGTEYRRPPRGGRG